jgi:cation transport ATPase
VTGSRERKRTERQKRKRRSAERTSSPGDDAPHAEESQSNGAPSAESFQEKMARRYEERNADARAQLEPLKEGERPTAVTVGAVVSAVLALIFTVSSVLAIAGVEAGDREIQPAPVIAFTIVFWVMTIGMWQARYWAVLGFQTLLLLMMLASALGLVVVGSVLQAFGTVLLLFGSATLFYFMIRAMARIQMPSPPGAD